jgi:23S rRNA (cytosine1962-C5)-methyltransferase
MRVAGGWQDYELLDCSAGERLERWGGVILIRPDPQVLWQTPKNHPLWRQAHACYHRAGTGGGHWVRTRPLPESWPVSWGALCFGVKPMGFKHTGLFPEQAVNWALLDGVIRGAGRPLAVLNLFAYTGGATLAALAAGARVTHVDAARGMVAWARENAARSGLEASPCRWIVDDCQKFVRRELRRGSRYDIVLMDPPAYGRGPGGEVWKLEEEIDGFVRLCAGLLRDDACLFLVNSYTAGLSPAAMGYLLHTALAGRGGTVLWDEIGLPVSASGQALPCGATAYWRGA